MRKARFYNMYKFFAALCFLFFVLIIAGEAFAVDILEIRVKRLYKEAQLMTSQGDYDAALQAYNKAISWAKDRDIKQFLINARNELQKKRRQERKGIETAPSLSDEKTGKPIAEKITSGLSAGEVTKASPQEKQEISAEKAKLEKEKADLEAERRKLVEEKARLEEEEREKEAKEEAARLEEEKTRLEVEKKKLEREKADLENERLQQEAAKPAEEKRREEVVKSTVEKPAAMEESTMSEEEKRRAEEEADRVKKIEEFKREQARLKGEKVLPVEQEKKEVGEKTIIEEKKPQEADQEELADLEQRKEREEKDRAIYEGTNYRRQVKDILSSAKNKLKEAGSMIEKEEARKRVETKIDKLKALDQQAEELVSAGAHEKARDIYKQILEMSKDPDIKECINKDKQLNQKRKE